MKSALGSLKIALCHISLSCDMASILVSQLTQLTSLFLFYLMNHSHGKHQLMNCCMMVYLVSHTAKYIFDVSVRYLNADRRLANHFQKSAWMSIQYLFWHCSVLCKSIWCDLPVLLFWYPLNIWQCARDI